MLAGGKRERALLADLLRPYPEEERLGYPVSTLVNSPGNKRPELIAETLLNSV